MGGLNGENRSPARPEQVPAAIRGWEPTLAMFLYLPAHRDAPPDALMAPQTHSNEPLTFGADLGRSCRAPLLSCRGLPRRWPPMQLVAPCPMQAKSELSDKKPASERSSGWRKYFSPPGFVLVANVRMVRNLGDFLAKPVLRTLFGKIEGFCRREISEFPSL